MNKKTLGVIIILIAIFGIYTLYSNSENKKAQSSEQEVKETLINENNSCAEEGQYLSDIANEGSFECCEGLGPVINGSESAICQKPGKQENIVNLENTFNAKKIFYTDKGSIEVEYRNGFAYIKGLGFDEKLQSHVGPVDNIEYVNSERTLTMTDTGEQLYIESPTKGTLLQAITDPNYFNTVINPCEFDDTCDHTVVEIPNDCKVWFDGCNTCSGNACTQKFCFENEKPSCIEYN